MQNSVNKNKGIRCPVKTSDFQDVNVTGFSIEKNHPLSEEFCAKDFSYYIFNYIIDGYGWATYGGKRIRLRPDMLYVVYPNSDASIVQDENEPYTLAWINCDGTKIKKILHSIGVNSKNLIVQLNYDKRIHKIFKQTPLECKKNIERSDIIALSAFYQIINLIQEQIKPVEEERKNRTSIVSIAAQYVKDNYSDCELSVSKIANSIGVSPKHLSTTFKKETNIELRHFITNCRLSKATELLTQGDLSIQQISEICGFSSPYYFSAVYKKYNLVPPSATMFDYRADRIGEETKLPHIINPKQKSKPKTKR